MITKKIILFFALVALSPLTLFAISIPDLKRPVTDEARILSGETIARLEAQLKAYEETTSNQIAVLTLVSLDGDSIAEVAVKVFETWKLGQKSKSNGVLLLIAPNERKMRIEVGYGLEGALTDLQASRIIKKVIKPRFKAGDIDLGVEDGVSAILGTISGEYHPDDSDVMTRSAAKQTRSQGGVNLVVGFVLLLVGLIIPSFAGAICLPFGLPFLQKGLLVFIPSQFVLLILILLGGLFIFLKFLFRNDSGIGGFGGGSGGYGGGFYSSGYSSDSWSSSDSSGGDSWSGGGGDSGGGGSSGDW